MRDYEMMYILSPDVGDENYGTAIDKINSLVSKLGGEISEVNQSAPWGKRRMAYPIEKHNDGYYVVTNLRIEPKQTGELERGLRLNEEVLRHLLISLSKD